MPSLFNSTCTVLSPRLSRYLYFVVTIAITPVGIEIATPVQQHPHLLLPLTPPSLTTTAVTFPPLFSLVPPLAVGVAIVPLWCSDSNIQWHNFQVHVCYVYVKVAV